MYGIRKEIFIMNNELKPILARVDHTLLSQIFADISIAYANNFDTASSFA